MPSRINMGPDGGPYIAINENSGNIELEDNTGTTVAIWDDANSQWDFQNNPISNVDSLTSNSLNTDRTAITEFSMGPTYTISRDSSRSPELVINDNRGNVVKSGGSLQLATFLQEIDDSIDTRWTAHFDSGEVFRFDQQVQLQNPVMWRGEGRNNTLLAPADGLSNDMILLNDTTSNQVPITRFDSLKFDARGPSIDSSVSCIKNVNHNELIFTNIEIRSFPQYNVHMAPGTDAVLRWNYADSSWFLDAGTANFYFDGSAPGVIEDYTFSNCHWQVNGSTVGMHFDGTGSSVRSISVNGGRVRSSGRPFKFEGCSDLYSVFNGIVFFEMNQESFEFVEPASERAAHVTISNCEINSNASSTPFNHIVVRDKWTDVFLDNNDLDPDVQGQEIAIVGGSEVWTDSTLFLSSTPSASDYTDRHAGKEIINTGASPTEQYKIDPDGNLIGPWTV